MGIASSKPMKPSRIVIVGTSGSGKSTLANKICELSGYKNIELDALFWKPSWEKSSSNEFRQKLVQEIQNSDKYVIHGNYGSVRDLIWKNVDTVIWLDYKRSLVMWRVIKRTIKRVITKEKLWNDNMETIKNSFFAKDAIIFWAWNTYNIRKKQYEELLSENPYAVNRIIRIKTPKETKKLLLEFT